ncbi:MAG TPA: cytochrome C [Verrucomicrobiae bacterium]|nr:cytochrome C [Verrucomicrobiae bacterium]
MPDDTGGKTRLSQQAVFRVGSLLFFILVVFAIIRQLLVPQSFGQYGYYRGDNVGEWVAIEQNYVSGSQACNTCHGAEVQETLQAEHGKLDCQTCHGPLAPHVRKPDQLPVKITGTAELCGSCHRELIGRSKELIPTVKVNEHSGGLDCTRCHSPHQPWAKIGGRKS